MPRQHRHLLLLIGAALLAGSSIAGDTHEKHPHNFSRDVDAFHAALAPLWHAKAGTERSQKVCAKANTLENLASEIQSGDAKPLLAATATLKVQCKATQTDIDAAFSRVHEAFHRLAEHN